MAQPPESKKVDIIVDEKSYRLHRDSFPLWLDHKSFLAVTPSIPEGKDEQNILINKYELLQEGQSYKSIAKRIKLLTIAASENTLHNASNIGKSLHRDTVRDVLQVSNAIVVIIWKIVLLILLILIIALTSIIIAWSNSITASISVFCGGIGVIYSFYHIHKPQLFNPIPT